ncbi:MAG: hypothetical protein AB7R40_23460 [Nitrospiraceae bacterium]
MTVRPDMEDLAQELGVREPLPHAVPIEPDVFAHFKSIADREGGSVKAVINDELRRRMGDR